jgi:hypothetical protein
VTEDLRRRIAEALRDHQPPTHVDSEGLPPDEFDCCADAVIAVLDETVLRPYTLDFSKADPELAEKFMAKIRAWELAGRPLKMLPPSAVMIRRRTPEERHRYLVEHRDEALAKGIPADLIDMMIDEAGESDA